MRYSQRLSPVVPRRPIGLVAPFTLAMCAVVLTSACSDPSQEIIDDPDVAEPIDADKTDGPVFEPNDTVSGGETFVTLTFDVDDSANKTYGDADIYWTGSFLWDEKTGGKAEFAPSWLPEERSWPPLYDDGPISAGGHEREGATKGDSIFSTQIVVSTKEDAVVEYGALNEDFNWMWLGANGTVTLKKGQQGVVAVAGLTLPKFGDVDLKLEFATDALHANFTKWNTKTQKFYVKGTMNTWTAVQLLDDGNKGDAAKDDGKLTYVHSLNLGPHDGKLVEESEAQFIFVTTTGDVLPKDGQEYKGATEAFADGVTAYTNTGPGGAWVPVDVVLREDSKGKFKNTAIVVPKKSTEPGCDPACDAWQSCVDGKCQDKACDPVCETWQTCEKAACTDKPCDPGCETWQACVKGACEDNACDPACGVGEKCEKAQCVNDPAACAPACEAGFECLKAKCMEKLCDPSCGAKQKCEKGSCLDLLDATKVEPLSGPLAGGTKITVTGQGFVAPAKVMVAAKECTKVFVKDDKHIECETPAGDKDGVVAVSVEVGGVKVEIKDAFTYKPLPKPTVLLVDPLKLAVKKGEALKGLKALVKVSGFTNTKGALDGLTVEFGYGKPLTHPEKSVGPAAWKWVAATFVSEDEAKGEELWTADLGILEAGEWWYTARAKFGPHVVYGDSDGSEDGVSLAKLGIGTVQEGATGPVVEGFDPPWSKTSGATITIVGQNLKKDFTVKVNTSHPAGANWPFKSGKNISEVPKGISVDIPAQPAGKSTVVITPPNLPDIQHKEPLYIVPWGTPKLDGETCYLPTCTGDWDPQGTHVLAQNAATSQWGAKNDIKTLLIALDKDNLYIGIQGSVEAQNGLVVYLDLDYGVAGGGVQNPADLKDNSGAVDAVVSSAIKVTDGSFGAEYAVASVGMGSFTEGDAAKSLVAGWRNLQKVDDFGWEKAPVHAKAGAGFEASIPLATLFPKGIDPKGTTLAVFAAIVNKDGSQVPTGAKLPQQQASKGDVVDTVLTLRIFPTK